MSDREKIIRAVETCFDSWIDKHRDMGLNLQEVEQMKHDALALLKEQEVPVKPVKKQIYSSLFGWVCGACGLPFFSDYYKYCPWCGRQVKW